MLKCCSAPPASSSASLRPSMPYPRVGLVVNVMTIRSFYGHFNISYIFDRVEIRPELYGANAEPRSKGRPSLSSPLPRFLLHFLFRPTCPPSAFLPCLTCSALPRSHPPSLPPRCQSSISPIHPDSSGRVATRRARTSFSLHLGNRLLASYRVRQPLPRKSSNVKSPEKLCSLDLNIRRLKPSQYATSI